MLQGTSGSANNGSTGQMFSSLHSPRRSPQNVPDALNLDDVPSLHTPAPSHATSSDNSSTTSGVSSAASSAAASPIILRENAGRSGENMQDGGVTMTGGGGWRGGKRV